MTDEALATLVVCYLAGSSITLMSMDAPSNERFLFRRLALWPLYWAYLLVKMGYMLVHDLRR